MNDLPHCRPDGDLRRFLLGQLPEADAVAIEQHLSGCSRCLDTIGAMRASDTLLEAMQSQATADPHPEADVVRQLMEKLSGLHAASSADHQEENVALAPPQSPEEIGRLGPYRVLKVLGTGGMGIVFQAEDPQFKRRVALKVIKPGMDSRQVIGRFEAERQALAVMDHPNIAKVFDAGTTDNGRPYFVMELVEGIPITRYCDEKHLTLKERLDLMIPVCQAIQHAHQKGIIHRDVKPTNILVAQYDGRPAPKVIDFGVAKATTQKLTEHTMSTELGQIVGTLEYMSPEQARLNQLDIDTRTDIYALGVLLYELLTGETPFDRQRLSSVPFDEMLRIIREEEPPKPSTRLSSNESLPSVAANRHVEPAQLTNLVRGELDWIVMKCLEKDRNRRYETADGVVMDVQRYLHDEPVEACPPSAWYRFRKFARRNKGPVLAAGLVVLALVSGIVGTTLGLFEARRQRGAAAAAAGAEKKAKETAEAREAETQAVLEFVENKILGAARPEGQEGGLGREVTLRKAIEAALPFGERSFIDQPLVEARLRMTLGASFEYLGEAKMAAVQYETARKIYIKNHGPDHLDTLRSQMGLANSYAALGRHAEALLLHEEALALRQAKLGYDHPETLRSMSNLGVCYDALGRHAEALKLREKTLALMKYRLGPEHHATLRSMSNLASSYAALGRHAEALMLREETLTLRNARLGHDHPDTLFSMMWLAISYAAVGRHADALKLYEETLALRKAKLGPDHPDTLETMRNLAGTYDALGRHAEAVKLLDETLGLQKAIFGIDHPHTLRGMNSLAWLLATCPEPEFRDPERAIELARKAVELQPNPGAYWTTLGVAQYRAGDWKAAVETLEKSTQLRNGDASDWLFLAMAHQRLGRTDQARMEYDDAIQWLQKNTSMLDPRRAEELRRFKSEAEEVLELDRA